MPEISLHEYEAEIDQLIEEARYLEALAHVRHIISHHPHYIGAYYLLGKMLLLQYSMQMLEDRIESQFLCLEGPRRTLCRQLWFTLKDLQLRRTLWSPMVTSPWVTENGSATSCKGPFLH